MKKIIISLLLSSAVWAQQTAPIFDQSLYDRHRCHATACLVGGIALAAVSLTAFLGSRNWANMESETENAINQLVQAEAEDEIIDAYKHQRDVQSGNKDRFLIACGISGGLSIFSFLIGAHHFYTAEDMLEAKTSISPSKAELGLAIRF